MVKINYKLLPVKAHYFFFMAAMGPILPFLNVFGKQLGVSEVVMGSITAVLPILFMIAKPTFGLIADYFQNQRQKLFIGLIIAGSTFYLLLYFIPQPESIGERDVNINNVPCVAPICLDSELSDSATCDSHNLNASCMWRCPGHNFTQNTSALFIALQNDNHETFSLNDYRICLLKNDTLPCTSDVSTSCNLTCLLEESGSKKNCLYGTAAFWGFVLLMSLGTIGFNVSNSISDAICFDVLGNGGEMGYGHQRVWGTIGFGVTALLAGWAIDWWSDGNHIKDYTPAFILVFVFTAVDVFCCTKLKLPPIPRSKNILQDIGKLLRHRHIVIFLMFAVLAGILDGFIIYYLFWFLEDLAFATGNMGNIKLLEGCVIAAETLVGEVIFFSVAGKVLRKIGYGNSLTLCFLFYSIRLGLISLITNPWWVVPIELFMQGPTYAMCYTTIVAYASAVSPTGASATMQGLVAGMDDGFGYAVGSLLGGFLYRLIGGSKTFQLLSVLALVCSIIHFGLYKCYLKKKMVKIDGTSNKNVEYKTPTEAIIATNTEEGKKTNKVAL